MINNLSKKTKYTFGFDIGSTTVNAVVVDSEKDTIIWQDYQRHETKQAEKVLEQTVKTIDMIEGGIQAQEMLLKKMNEQESQPTDIEGQDPVLESKSAKTKGQPA